MKPFYALALAEDQTTANLTIRGRIGGDWYEGCPIQQFEYDLERIGAVNTIVMRVTSFGGKLEDGLAMHNALARHPARIIGIVEGVAASAGTLPLMAADEIRMYANSTMMIHGVSLEDEAGNPVTDDEASRALNASLIETYAARTGKSAEELAAMIATDTWMTARQAVEAGWADTVIEISEESAPATATASSPLVAIAAALDIPADVLARAQAEAAGQGAEHEASEGGDPQPAPAAPAADPAPANAEASATFAAQINALAVAHGLGDHVAAWLLDGGITTTAQAEAAIKEAREVRDLCAFANAADRAPGFIRARKSLAEVRAELINAQAAAADQQHTDGHQRSSGGAVQPTGAAVWAKIFPTRQTKE